ncbi:hypothetical protein MCHI_002958 [Candidatus Magnetoovum chiemensis]|nr:hypothetical protein MCHI_002958 [Candidatus Magnetoovum chiemensis]
MRASLYHWQISIFVICCHVKHYIIKFFLKSNGSENKRFDNNKSFILDLM